MLYIFSCMLVAHTILWLKIIQYQIYSYKHDRDSCKKQLVACQLHSDWLQTTRFFNNDDKINSHEHYDEC